MSSSGMRHRVDLVRTDVSEECIASIIRVEGTDSLADSFHPDGDHAFL
jgi:hypothetical protein